MRYSVYNYVKGNFDYFDGSGVPPAYGTFRTPSTDLSPESMAVKLPRDAVKVGEGTIAQGTIAADDSRALAAYGSDGDTPWYYMATLFVMGWFLGRKHGK